MTVGRLHPFQCRTAMSRQCTRTALDHADDGACETSSRCRTDFVRVAAAGIHRTRALALCEKWMKAISCKPGSSTFMDAGRGAPLVALRTPQSGTPIEAGATPQSGTPIEAGAMRTPIKDTHHPSAPIGDTHQSQRNASLTGDTHQSQSDAFHASPLGDTRQSQRDAGQCCGAARLRCGGDRVEDQGSASRASIATSTACARSSPACISPTNRARRRPALSTRQKAGQ